MQIAAPSHRPKEKGPLNSQRPFALIILIFAFDSIRSARIRPALGAKPLGKRVNRAAEKVVRPSLRSRRKRPASGWHNSHTIASRASANFRKEVIQPQVLLRLPCYDFTPIMNYTLGGCPLAVGSPTSSTTHFRDVTGGVYKARERIHRGVLIRDY